MLYRTFISLRFLPLLLSGALLIVSLAACGDKSPQGGAGGFPPAEVAVLVVQPERAVVSAELPGRLEATRVAQVRARVPGVVLKLAYREGSDVKAGDVLFEIDPAPFKAAYQAASATLARAQANYAQAQMKVQRNKPLVESSAISKQEYEDSETVLAQTGADLESAKAAVMTAQLNLGYSTVTAPISGSIGRSLVTVGALVGQSEVTPLATIQQLDPIFVTMTQSSSELMQLRNALTSGKIKGTAKDKAQVSLVMEDGQIYEHKGRLLFSELTVDEGTGAVTLRAEFPNPARRLLPGMYARARLEQGMNEKAILVPQGAVIRSQDGASVLLVADDGKVSSRQVTTGAAYGNRWEVTQGLSAGDRIVVEGLQKARPGATVKPVTAAPSPAPAPAASSPAKSG
jgi:membrane fusion protein (multidrug efflux system)